MPLSKPVAREPLHTRVISMSGYIRDDGLWDIEGQLVDNKHYEFENDWRGTVTPDMPVHEMWVRLTVDDDLVIQECEAATDNHPFPVCPDITPNYAKLKGVRIGPGWMREVRRVAGGNHGCTHIVEMLSQMGTTAYQTHVAKRRIKGEQATAPTDGAAKNQDAPKKRPMIIDTCHALSSDGPIVQETWPEWYTGEGKSPKT